VAVKVAEPFRTAKVKARSIRRSFEIHGYTGSNGGGKSLAAVYDSLPTLAAGRPIVSTVRILDPATGEPHPLWIPLDDFRTLLEVEFCDVILDEVTGVASSRDSAGMPSAVLNHLMQLRRRDVSLRWTTPNWKRADTGIREVTRGLTTCVGLVPEPAPKSDDGLDRIWRSRRLFFWRTFDAKDFDEWSTAKERSSSKQHRLKPAARQFVWRGALWKGGPSLIAGHAYDTFDQVLSLGVVSDAGLCMDCGGKRTAKRCNCDKLAEGEVIDHDPSPGQLAWREFDAARVANGTRPVLLDETDDTPGVLVDTSAA
jgi:hypothetical protein